MSTTADERITSYYYSTDGYGKAVLRGTPVKRITIWMSEDDLALIEQVAEARHHLIDRAVGSVKTIEAQR